MHNLQNFVIRSDDLNSLTAFIIIRMELKQKHIILLVEPNFPIPSKSKNHKNFLPIGLLKLHDYYKSENHKVKLIRGNKNKREIGTRFKPDKIMITSLFTYWSKYVKDCVEHYRKLFPNAEIEVGGIYASLQPKHCKTYTKCDKVHIGVNKRAEKYTERHRLNYAILSNSHPIDYQIIHASRGCPKRCSFCGVWKVEKKVTSKKSILNEICSNKLIFYDNNILANPYIDKILKEISEYKFNNKCVICESQSGFDGRILIEKPHLAKLIKDARFISPRIAWDHGYKEWRNIKKQIDILVNAGYKSNDIFIFMLYNWDMPFIEMERKRIKCWKWKVQISDCRYRPLTQYFDKYKLKSSDVKENYHIHNNWRDEEIKQFRKNVRRHNICVRQELNYYSRSLELKSIDKKLTYKLRSNSIKDARKILNDLWDPDEKTSPEVKLFT